MILGDTDLGSVDLKQLTSGRGVCTSLYYYGMYIECMYTLYIRTYMFTYIRSAYIYRRPPRYSARSEQTRKGVNKEQGSSIS